MSDQFDATRFARGVKVTTQHVYTPLDNIANEALGAGITGNAEPDGRFSALWSVPWLDRLGTVGGLPAATMPFLIPPMQQKFNRETLRTPEETVTLVELSLAVDQRAEPFGITGPTAAAVGVLTDCDPDRLTVTVKLKERTPFCLTNQTAADSATATELLSLEFSGASVFASEFNRTPRVVSNLSVQIKPWKVYFWEVYAPGLNTVNPAESQLAIVSLALKATFSAPLVVRDNVEDFATPPGIQNMPTKHSGYKNGTTIAVAPPAANALITGTDVQGALHEFDLSLRNRLPSGYGVGEGSLANQMQAADAPPHEMLEKDAHTTMIVVPMWSGQGLGNVQPGDLGTVVLPWMNYPAAGAPYTRPCMDVRMIPVPDNFVLHHVFACWSNSAPGGTPATCGTRPTDPDFRQRVSVSLNTGGRADNALQQQVAYLSWYGNTSTATFVDLYEPYFQSTPTQVAQFSILEVPLVWPNVTWDGNTYFASGQPFFMGTANSTTQARTNCGTLPGAFGGGALHVPFTEGQERNLEIRWSKSRDAAGLGLETLPAANVIVGQGGDWVILVGRQVSSR